MCHNNDYWKYPKIKAGPIFVYMYICVCATEWHKHWKCTYLFYFSHILTLTLIFLGIIINLLPLYRLSYFVFVL
jgi:hypothetical protein